MVNMLRTQIEKLIDKTGKIDEKNDGLKSTWTVRKSEAFNSQSFLIGNNFRQEVELELEKIIKPIVEKAMTDGEAEALDKTLGEILGMIKLPETKFSYMKKLHGLISEYKENGFVDTNKPIGFLRHEEMKTL